MDVHVLREGLTPRVQDGGDADGATEMGGIAPEGEEGLGGRPEQQGVDQARIALPRATAHSPGIGTWDSADCDRS